MHVQDVRHCLTAYNRQPMADDDISRFWIAVPGADDNLTLLGPFPQSVATQERETILRSFPDRKVSPVFASANRASAEVNARYFLPQP